MRAFASAAAAHVAMSPDAAPASDAGAGARRSRRPADGHAAVRRSAAVAVNVVCASGPPSVVMGPILTTDPAALQELHEVDAASAASS